MARSCSPRRPARSPPMGEGVVVRPEQVSLWGCWSTRCPGTLWMRRSRCVGVGEALGRQAAHAVITDLALALWLFPDDDDAGGATEVTGLLDRWGCSYA